MLRAIQQLTAAIALGALVAAAPASAQLLTRSSSFAYDANTGLLTQETVEPCNNPPCDPTLQLQTQYVYDAFGNKTSASTSGDDIGTRTSATTYDPKGEFPIKSTNALSQTELWQYDPRFGKPTSHTDLNNLVTTWSYDSFGRKTSEVRPDGTQTKWQYLLCSSVSGGCPSGAYFPTAVAYLIQATPYAPNGAQNGPFGIVYYDMLDREVARDTQGFDGSIIRVIKQYDSFGNLVKESRPFFSGSGTPLLTQYVYDALNRVISEIYPIRPRASRI